MTDLTQNTENNDIGMLDDSDVDFTATMQLYRQRDMAQAYHRITQEMGPSAQLLAFVNYDNNLSQELGIGLESFELETQHELLLQHLDISVMDQIATESFLDKLKQYRWHLVAGGFGVGVASVGASFGYMLKTGDVKTAVKIGKAGVFAGKAILAAGAAIVVADSVDKLTVRYDNFTEYKKQFEGQFTRINAFVTSMPTNVDADGWKKLEETLNKNKSHTARPRGDKTHFNQAGWTESNYVAALKWLENQDKNLLEISKKLGSKIETLENKVKEGEKNSSTVASVIFASTKIMHEAKSSLLEVKTILNAVASNFEPKDK